MNTDAKDPKPVKRESPLACPLCSTRHRPVTPAWRFAQRTSAKRGVRCAFLLGCPHIEAIGGPAVIEAPAAAATIARWNAEALRLFDEWTARWTPEQRSTFRRRIGHPKPATQDAELSTPASP